MTDSESAKYMNWGLFVLRATLGIIFLYHAWTNFQAFSNLSLLLQLVSIAELIGGFALIAGFQTRLAALGFAVIMVGAIYYKMTGQFGQVIGFSEGTTTGWEFDFALLGAAVALIGTGAGCFAMDCKACMVKMKSKSMA